MGVTRDSGIVSIAADVLGMSVMRWMRGVGGVCYCCLPRPGPSSSQSWFPLSRYLNARIDLTGFRHRFSGDKSVGCVVQANRCCLVRLTPYACSPVIDGSVLTVVVRECIVVFG